MTQRAFSSTIGPVQQHIQDKITEILSPEVLIVTNESHRRMEDESHFHVLVVSKEFVTVKSMIKRHRMVQNLFVDENGNLKFHSLRLTTKTPEQWAKSEAVSKAPKCTGKGDGRSATDATKLN